MSGHSKFSNIKHKKEKADSTRGKIFTKIGRELAVAVKAGGPDPNNNSRLWDVVAKAKVNNMPNDTIERSIKKAAGDLDAVNYESIVYEGYGPCGVAVIATALTDNRNRTAGNVRSCFTKGGGNMGTSGCVSFLFDEVGHILVERNDGIDEDALMLMALDAGAADFTAEEDGYVIITQPQDFAAVHTLLESSRVPLLSAEITRLPQTTVRLTDPDDIKKMNKLLDLLMDDDDVQDVYHNWENE